MPSAALADFQSRLVSLEKLSYSSQLKEQVEKFISEIPAIQDDTSRADKVIIHVLRAKAMLLLPTYSTEAEADLNRALKLDPSSSPDTYVALSECLWRKNQEQEAVDAVHSALGIDPKNIPALCQLSRLVRSLASKEGPTQDQKADLLQQSVAKAKEALAVDLNSGEAWSALGLAHIQVAVATGFGYSGMKKALAAMQQAVTKRPEDPDVHYNFAVVLECTGNYAQAAVEYTRAAEIDPLLKGANKSADNCKLTIQRHLSCVKEAVKNDSLKKELLFKLPSSKPAAAGGVATLSTLEELLAITPAEMKNSKGNAISLMVVGLISPQGVYPLCYHCVDRNSESCMLLVPRLQSSAVQKRDVVTVTLPPCSIATAQQKDVQTDDKNVKASFQSTIIAADPDALMVNSVPVPEKLYMPAQMSSRLFQ